MKILNSTRDIQREVVRLMKPGTRRVVVTAFVGAGASAYIPSSGGVTIVCWPKAGGTNPSAIRELMRRGAVVRFVDKLHMKLYWAEQRGAVIGSANLSTNALGSGGLRELAVALPSASIPINSILRTLKMRKVTEKELNRLDLEHRKLGARLAGKESNITYRQWFDSVVRSKWKLGWYDEMENFSREARATARADFNRSPVGSMVGRKRDYKAGDWVLTFRASRTRVFSARWLYVNFVVKVGGANLKYPYDAVQVWSQRECTMPPFELSKSFNQALVIACNEFGINKLRRLRTTTPPERLLRHIYDAS